MSKEEMHRLDKRSRRKSIFPCVVASISWIVTFVLTTLIFVIATKPGLPSSAPPIGLVVIFLSIIACSIPINMALFGMVVDPVLRCSRHKTPLRLALLIFIVAFSWYVGAQSLQGIESLNHPFVAFPFAAGACSAFFCYLGMLKATR